jgi:hypothetical protein
MTALERRASSLESEGPSLGCPGYSPMADRLIGELEPTKTMDWSLSSVSVGHIWMDARQGWPLLTRASDVLCCVVGSLKD